MSEHCEIEWGECHSVRGVGDHKCGRIKGHFPTYHHCGYCGDTLENEDDDAVVVPENVKPG